MSRACVLVILAWNGLLNVGAADGLVELHVVNSIGERVPSYKVEHLTDRQGRDFREQVRSGLVSLPFGTYQLRVTSQKGGSRQQIGVYQDYVFVVVDIGGIDYPDRTSDDIIHGKVLRSSRPSAKQWVKSVPLFGLNAATWRVHSDGSFLLHNLAPGAYILLLFEGQQVVATKVYQFETPNHPPVNIRVP